MKRLTTRVDYDYDYQYGSVGVPCDNPDYLEIVYNKLGQLEDIEEELGVGLDILFKALKKGIFVETYNFRCDEPKNNYKIVTRSIEYYASSSFYLTVVGDGEYIFTKEEGDVICYIKDYGKKWALTKEELEKKV